MLYEDYKDLPDLEVIRKTWGQAVTNPGAASVDRLLRLRTAERDADTSAKLVASTDSLVAATKRLGTVTWWLVGGTVLMGLAAGTDVLLKLMNVLDR